MTTKVPTYKDKKDITKTNEILVEVTGLSKKFCKDLKTSLWYGVKDLVAGYSGNKNERELRPKEFWAVKDISFTLKRGECLGLIGHNGAGKSTLLKILNGLINPDAGKILMKGRVGALIELGAGFNPILSGRENIYNNGAILGFTRKEIDEKLEHIIEFAELQEFIDMPVRNYSSGMKVRLGFAVAAQMQPDVLIIDEVLAVGDIGFVTKCYKTIDAILPNTALIFVSHSMPAVSRICNKILLMDKGLSKFQGEKVSEGIDQYYTRFASNDSTVVFDDESLKVNKIEFLGCTYFQGTPQTKWNDDLKIFLSLESTLDYVPSPMLNIYDKEQRPVATVNQRDFKAQTSNQTDLNYIIILPKLQLSKGVYNIELIVHERKSSAVKLRVRQIASFQVTHEEDTWPPLLIDSMIDLKQ